MPGLRKQWLLFMAAPARELARTLKGVTKDEKHREKRQRQKKTARTSTRHVV
jgi:hypothetical protein